MPIPETDPSHSFEALADAQLQEELRSLFAIDTQTYLQKYNQIVQSLQPQSWRADIQELYRCIHTIKGGAVTVGAEAVLHIATALEDVLSDLRYLEQAPNLGDDYLSQSLLETGELLTGALESAQSGRIEPILNRIQALHQDLRERYLPQWNEMSQLHREFAEQGIDLIGLELEVALEQLPDRGQVPDSALHTAQHILEQLGQIGTELQFAAGWLELLDEAQKLLAHPTNSVWKTQWKPFLQALKTCAKQSGKPVLFEFPSFAAEIDWGQLGEPPSEPLSPSVDWLETLSEPSSHSINWFEQSSDEDLEAWLEPLSKVNQTDDLFNPISGPPATSEVELPSPIPAPVELPAASDRSIDTPEIIQIPVPLEKLDQSAQHMIETLITLRNTQGVYQTLQSQIVQLVTLAQEGTQYITHLRQIQDDYTLLEELRNSAQDASQGPIPERYRQGYTVINRLLETSLRLSEIGAETGKVSQQVAEYLRDINNHVLKLQTTIESSRLVPFQNLSFRARAILRDLTIRFDKPAQLTVQGEQTELDISIARTLEPILLHLIRNAYDHGLEPPTERSAQGKPEQGQIELALRQQGNQFQFEIRDDGRGIDAKTIQAKAEALGLPLTNTQTAAELLAVICQPGFSVQDQVNEISGRGIGMDVVAAQVARLGGQLSLHTLPGTGTTFRLQFPVPRLLVSCVLLQAGSHTFAIPNDDIKTIRLWSSLNVSPVEEENQAYAWRIHDEHGSCPAIDLLKYWQPHLTQRPLSDTSICLLIAAQDGQPGTWLLADDLLEQAELIINPLPAPLTAPSGLIGLSLQPDGCLIPVLQAQELATQILATPAPAGTIPIAPTASDQATADALTPEILIVDDAALMRRRLESSLNTYGYLTYTCADGQEAWNWLQAESPPDLIITDIEMPNMDGFTLIDRCRQAGIRVPILVISSRLSEEWSDEAKRLGANDYLTKGFSTVDLVKKVSHLIAEQSARKIENLSLLHLSELDSSV